MDFLANPKVLFFKKNRHVWGAWYMPGISRVLFNPHNNVLLWIQNISSSPKVTPLEPGSKFKQEAPVSRG